MKTLLLQIPTKKTDEVNWAKTLNSYLLSVYGNSSENQQDVESFNKLRLDLRGCHADATGIRLYFRYYSQLELLDLRIPFATANRSKKIEFKWYDAFDTAESHKQHSLAFEKASILFNLGALLSRLAKTKYHESQRSSSSLSDSDNALKESLQYFQQAAGVYEFLRENFLHAPSRDLGQSTIRFLVNLCLAQAQEVFVLKLISGDTEQKQNSLIAKLCSSAAVHYDDCYAMAKDAATSKDSKFDSAGYTVVDTFEDDFDEPEGGGLDSEYDPAESEQPKVAVTLEAHWPELLRLKKTLYKSLAYYHFGLHQELLKKYGDAIANLSRSHAILGELDETSLKALNFDNRGEAYEVLDFFNYQKEAVSIKLADLEKDNDFIYHEIIPNTTSLSSIKPLDSAKIITLAGNTTFNEVSETNYNNFLKNVVPIHIHELMSYYSEQKAQFLRSELDMVDVTDEEAASALEYLKLPKALVMLKGMLQSSQATSSDIEGKVQPEIVRMALEIMAHIHNDTENRKALVELRQLIFSTVTEVDSILNNQMSDTSILKDDLMKVKKALYDASNSDGKLLNLISSDNNALYNILGKGPDSAEFHQLFEAKSSVKKSNDLNLLDMDDSQIADLDVEGQIKSLEENLHDINVIKQKKKKLIDALKDAIHNDDISDILILNSNIKSVNEIKTVIFEEELKKFDKYAKELDLLLTEQKHLVDQLGQKWQTLSSNPEVKNIQSSSQFKQQTMNLQSSKVKNFYNDCWLGYNDGLAKGVEFYKQLLGFAQTLKKRALDGPQAGIEDRFRAMRMQSNQSALQANHSGSRYSQQYQTPQQFERKSNQGSIASQGSGLPRGHNFGPTPQMTGLERVSAQPTGTSNYTRPAPALPPKPPKESQTHLSSQNDGLIYNQPSTYLPNMYNFFSNS